MAVTNRSLFKYVIILVGIVFYGGLTTLPKANADDFTPVELRIESGRDQDGQFTLAGSQARQQLLLTGRSSQGDFRDLTREAKFDVAPIGIASIDANGVVRAIHSGAAQITASHPTGQSAVIAVNVEEAE